MSAISASKSVKSVIITEKIVRELIPVIVVEQLKEQKGASS